MQAARDSIKALSAEGVARTLPLTHSIDLCHDLLAQRMLPVWLQVVCAKAPRNNSATPTTSSKSSGAGATCSYKVLQTPAYWAFGKHVGLAQFMLQYDRE